MSTKQYCKLILLLMLLSCISNGIAAQVLVSHKVEQEYQWHVDYSFLDAKQKPKKTTAYLWIPPNTKKVSGVIIASQNVLEQWLVEHALIRDVCRKANIAILWACPSFFVDGPTHHPEINIPVIQYLLDTLSNISGYNNLQRVPWLPIGHSGTNNLVDVLVAEVPHKLIAAVKMKGGPGFKTTTVPVLSTAGEFFEWNQHKEDLLNPKKGIPNYHAVLEERAQRQHPLSYFFDPNTGHFDCSEALTALVAAYIESACEMRLSSASDTTLLPVDMRKGWVVGLPLPGAKPMLPKKYLLAKGEEQHYPWYFSKSLAMKAYQLATYNFNRKAQLLAFTDSNAHAYGYTRGIVWPLPYTTTTDGVRFQLHATRLAHIPDTFLQAKQPLDSSNKPWYMQVLCGNLKQTGYNTFDITPHRSYKAATTYVVLKQDGDDKVRTTIAPAQVVLTPNSKGVPQMITFKPLENIDVSVKRIALQATTSSGMPVRFYVKSGPAYVIDNELMITTLPANATFPVRVTVVAYQWGRTVDPPIQTAPTVEQVFYITR